MAGVAFWVAAGIATGAAAGCARIVGAWNRAKLKADRATNRVFFIIMILICVKLGGEVKTKKR
jgi:hypothetical protein